MTTFSDATVAKFTMQVQQGDCLQLSPLIRPTLLNRDVVSRLKAVRDHSGLVIASTRVVEIDRAFDDRGGCSRSRCRPSRCLKPLVLGWLRGEQAFKLHISSLGGMEGLDEIGIGASVCVIHIEN
jgi:hypothetical protein